MSPQVPQEQRQKHYLTPEGYRELVEELEYLTTVRRLEVAEHIRQAKADGDIAENVGYQEAKEEQAFLEGRIQTLEMLLADAVIIDQEKRPNDGTVGLGSRVTVSAEDNDRPETYLVVGSAEADPLQGRISAESPLGKALLGHKAGDEVVAPSLTFVAPLGQTPRELPLPSS